ncbi:MAG: sigma-54 dependent transcriptional regulator [Gammaproteobacteria bacterium]|nr:sigma-54 dependent transcriptional regulator [Gammaproteobacteria bacterium]MDH3428608.1 sigma-54 dependent transcriptional regulator [Gammaproteobacteria bacterium]MDH3433308.1 sigma-54 dependent transcriptional regulator [Gammaproteobacteria bacterium]
MTDSAKILIVDDDEDILTAGRLLLRRSFGDVITCRRPEEVPDLLEQHAFDAVMLDMNFGPGESSGKQGLEWLERILLIDPQMVVVMITAHGSVDTVVEAMKRGATDFVAKPWQNEKVVATISAAVELHRSRIETHSLRRANRALREATSGADTAIVGTSVPMREVLSIVERTAPTDANILILGENGTGKELIAREVHRRSSRSHQVFLTVDMGSISESLFESELFGHRKGAFTGADDDRLGRFQAADGGTLFLDEIGNLQPHLQIKLLRALEQRRVTPVGSDKAQEFNVRVIAATNVPAEALRDERRFRPDLLFRLNTVEITVPPLRERRDDILPIASHYSRIYSRKYDKAARSFSSAAEKAMLEYDWPGNVRALRHSVERAVILAAGPVLEVDDLQLRPGVTVAESSAPEPVALSLEQVERQTIESVLQKHGFNISHAAKELGLTRASLYRRMEKHGL